MPCRRARVPSFPAGACVLTVFVVACSSSAQIVSREFVTTPEAFFAAITSGKRNVVIGQHLDLTGLAGPNTTAISPSATTQTIRGSCTTSFSGAALPLQVTGQQCVIDVAGPFLDMQAQSSRLILSNVYVRLVRPPPEDGAPGPALVTMVTVTGGDLLMLDSTLYGDSAASVAGQVGPSRKVHAQGCIFASMRAPDGGAGWRVAPNGLAGFGRTSFRNLVTPQAPGAALRLQPAGPSDASPQAWLQGCYFSNIAATPAAAERSTATSSARLYSDKHYFSLFYELGAEPPGLAANPQQPLPLDATGWASIVQRGFLGAADFPDFDAIAEEEAKETGLPKLIVPNVRQSAANAADAERGDAPPAEGSTNVAVIAGTVCAVIAAALLAVLLGLWLWRRRAARSAEDAKVAHAAQLGTYMDTFPPEMIMASMHSQQSAARSGIGAGSSPSRYMLAAAYGHPLGHPGSAASPLAGPPALPPGALDSAPSDLDGATWLPATHGGSGSVASGLPGGKPAPPLSAAAAALLHSADGRRGQSGTLSDTSLRSARRVMSGGSPYDRALLEQALDELFDMQIPFLNRFELLGYIHRRFGGQGIVQFARDVQGGEEFAIKFFTNRAAFEREQALYTRNELRTMMPAVKGVVPNADGRIMTASGWVFPPCIIVERGESLDEWALRIEPDFPTILTVLCHILARLNQLHAAGLAHRDLKPGNVLWRPKTHSWTLIDFGCAAEIGTTTGLSFSLTYAPPESLHALAAGARTTTSDPAADMWALGVIAYELLCRRRAFRRGLSQEQIRAQILGAEPLPWETPSLRKRNVPELRMLKRTVLACLDRDALRRPSAREVLQAWNNLFDAATKGTMTSPGDEDSESGGGGGGVGGEEGAPRSGTASATGGEGVQTWS